MGVFSSCRGEPGPVAPPMSGEEEEEAFEGDDGFVAIPARLSGGLLCEGPPRLCEAPAKVAEGLRGSEEVNGCGDDCA